MFISKVQLRKDVDKLIKQLYDKEGEDFEYGYPPSVTWGLIKGKIAREVSFNDKYKSSQSETNKQLYKEIESLNTLIKETEQRFWLLEQKVANK